MYCNEANDIVKLAIGSTLGLQIICSIIICYRNVLNRCAMSYMHDVI